jgi:hypothetical protein
LSDAGCRLSVLQEPRAADRHPQSRRVLLPVHPRFPIEHA